MRDDREIRAKKFIGGSMSTCKKVFISSPYTLGDTAANVRLQHDAFNALLQPLHLRHCFLTIRVDLSTL